MTETTSSSNSSFALPTDLKDALRGLGDFPRVKQLYDAGDIESAKTELRELVKGFMGEVWAAVKARDVAIKAHDAAIKDDDESARDAAVKARDAAIAAQEAATRNAKACRLTMFAIDLHTSNDGNLVD